MLFKDSMEIPKEQNNSNKSKSSVWCRTRQNKVHQRFQINMGSTKENFIFMEFENQEQDLRTLSKQNFKTWKVINQKSKKKCNLKKLSKLARPLKNKIIPETNP